MTAVCNRKWIYTTHLPQTLTWKSIRISTVIMLDANNIRRPMAVGISLLSRIQAEIFFHINFQLHGSIFEFSFTPHQSSRVAWHRYKRWNFDALVYTSWDTRYSISTSGYRPSSLIYYLPQRSRVFALALPCFWTIQMAVPWKFADISFAS